MAKPAAISLVAPDLSDHDPILTFREGCELLKVSKRLGWSKVNSGELPHLRIGRLIRFRRSALLEWAAQQEQAATEGRS